MRKFGWWKTMEDIKYKPMTFKPPFDGQKGDIESI